MRYNRDSSLTILSNLFVTHGFLRKFSLCYRESCTIRFKSPRLRQEGKIGGKASKISPKIPIRKEVKAKFVCSQNIDNQSIDEARTSMSLTFGQKVVTYV